MAREMGSCCSCGEPFAKDRRGQTMCLDCRFAKSIRIASHERRCVSQLDENIRKADAAGVSYGKWKALQRSGKVV